MKPLGSTRTLIRPWEKLYFMHRFVLDNSIDVDEQTPAKDRTTSLIEMRFYEAFRRLISPNGIARVTIFITMVVRNCS